MKNKVLISLILIAGLLFIVFGIFILKNNKKTPINSDKIIDVIKFNEGVQYNYKSAKIVVKYYDGYEYTTINGKTTQTKGKKAPIFKTDEVECTKNICKDSVTYEKYDGGENTILKVKVKNNKLKEGFLKFYLNEDGILYSQVYKYEVLKNKKEEVFGFVMIPGHHEKLVFEDSAKIDFEKQFVDTSKAE